MSGPLGWDYPAGAEDDPNAPWNQHDEHDGPSREEIEIEKADRAMDDDKDRAAEERE